MLNMYHLVSIIGATYDSNIGGQVKWSNLIMQVYLKLCVAIMQLLIGHLYWDYKEVRVNKVLLIEMDVQSYLKT